MTSMVNGFGAFKPLKALKKVGSGVAKGAKFVAKTAVDVHKLPLNALLIASAQGAKVVCALPPPALMAAVAAAGLGPAAITTVPIFCKAVRAGAADTIRKLLPQMLKIAAAAAAGAFKAKTPAAIPIVTEAAPAVIRRIDPNNEETEDALEGADLELLGYFAMHPTPVLESALAGADDTDILTSIGAPPPAVRDGVVLGLSLIALGGGLFLALRR
jgi:hypothetical protein